MRSLDTFLIPVFRITCCPAPVNGFRYIETHFDITNQYCILSRICTVITAAIKKRILTGKISGPIIRSGSWMTYRPDPVPDWHQQKRYNQWVLILL